MRVRPVTSSDLAEWLRMRCTLWPEASPPELRAEMVEYLDNHADPGDKRMGKTLAYDLGATFVAERADRGLCGFIELSLRNIVDGCTTSPVGYIEGWFVDDDRRKQGIGRLLVQAGEAWARQQGCTEMGSDTELENEASQTAHRALGYEVSDRLVVFRRSL